MAQRQQQAAPVTHWRKVHKRKNEHLLFSEDIGPVGRAVNVEVVDSGVIDVSGADDKKKAMPWLAFRGPDGKPKQKRLALNVTNCKTMQSITGSPVVEQWRGWITLTVVETTYYDQQTKRNETTNAIRIAPKRPRPSDQRDTSPAETEPPVDSGPEPPLSDADKRAIEMAEAEEARRG